jgi:endonuclease/exonuclease/phosphatase family metal-dependent hydrolase
MRALRVLTLNIWNCSGPWEQRREVIRRGLRDLDPDVIGLQEVLRPMSADSASADTGVGQVQELAVELGYHVAYGAAFETGGMEFGNAVLSRYPVQATHVLALPQLDSPYPRSLLHAELASPFGQIPFFVTHLTHRFHEGHVREAQVKAIAAHVKELAPLQQFPAILVGDFNATPASDEIRYLSGLASLGAKSTYFCDTFALMGRGEGITFSHHNPYAADLREPDRRIDYVFVRGPNARGLGAPLAAQVCFDGAHDGIFASDHYGVMATLRAEV